MSIEKQIVFSTKLIEEIAEKNNKGYVIARNEKYWYSNLVQVKREGVTFSMTDEEMQEYIKCYVGIVNVRYVTKEVNGQLIKEIEGDIPDMESGQEPELKGIHYFAEKYCKIKREDGSTGAMRLRDYQKDIIDLYMENRFSILCGSRQIGKTVSAAIAVLYYVTFNTDKNVLITANKIDTVKEIINKVKSIYYLLPFWLKPSVQNWNQTTISFASTGCVIKSAAATPNAGIGNTIDFLYVDEMAHLPRNILDEFYRALYPTVSAVNNSKIVVTSTPNGYNLFHKLLVGAEKPIGDKDKNNYKALRVYWWQVPGRYVTYLRLDNFVCKQLGIEHKEVFAMVKELGFDCELKFSTSEQRWEIWIPNTDDKLPEFMIQMSKGKEGEDVVSDYFRGIWYENKLEDGSIKKHRLIEFCDVSSWKEDAIKDIGGIEKFNQEYDLQFANGNKQIFDAQTLQRFTNSKKIFTHSKIPTIDAKSFVNYDNLKWIEDPSLFILEDIKSYHMAISIDISEGLGQDYSVINFFRILPKDEKDWSLNIENINDLFKLEQVGLFRSNIISVPELAELVYMLCFEVMNPDKLGVVLEINMFGGELLGKMKDLFNGRNEFSQHIFYRYKHRADAIKTDIGIKLRQNKNLYVKEYQKRLKAGDVIVHEESTILEITTFIKEETSAGNMQFKADGGHDDVVMTVVEVSTIFDSIKFSETISALIDELPDSLKTAIEKRIGDSPNLVADDYTALFKAQRKASTPSTPIWGGDSNTSSGWGTLGGSGGGGWGSLGGSNGNWGTLGGNKTGGLW